MEVNYKLKRFASMLLVIVMMFSFISWPTAEAEAKKVLKPRNTGMQVLVSCNRISGMVGDTLTWTSTPVGGKAPYQYAFYLYKDGVYQLQRWYTSSNSFSYIPSSAGNYKVIAFIKDSANVSRFVASKEVNIKAYPALKITKVYANKDKAKVGESIVWTTNAEGGKAPYTYAYYVYQDSVRIHTTAYTTANYISHTPLEKGDYCVTCFVKDSLGKVISKTSPHVPVADIAADPLDITNIIANKVDSSIVGDPLVWTIHAKGGKAPYQYKYEVYKNGTLLITEEYSTNASYSYTPTEIGIYKIIAYVKDANDTVNFRSSKDISVLSNPLALNVQVDKVGLKNNEKVTFYANAYGGKSPYEYSYYIYESGVLQKSVPYSSNASYTYEPTVVGTYEAKVSVRDNEGTVVTETSPQVIVTAYVPPIVASITQNIPAPKVGDEVVWTLTAADGSKPYTYAWYLYKDGVRIATTPYTLSNVYKYTITTIGEYYVVGFVKDKCGNAAFKATNKFIATSVPLSINSVNASATTVPRNMPITWTTIAVGGKAPLTYSYHLYYNGNRIVTTPYSTNKTYTYTPYATGNYHVEVFVKDDAGQSDSMISAATAVTNTSNLKVSVSYAPLNPSIGTTITATIAASDGITPYKYAFYVYRNGAKVLTTNYSTNNKLTYKIPQSGTYYVVGFAKDAYNTTKFAKTANIIVNVVPLSFDLNINKTATTVNDTVTASITNVKGGVAPYQYAFYVYNGTTKVYTRAYNTNASLVYKFTSAGVYKIMAFVRDDVGTIVHKTSANINVINPDTQPLQLVITAAAPNVPVGQIMRWNVKAWGGAAPYSFTYVLYKKAADSTLTKIKTTTSTNNYFEYMPTITGDYVVEVTVKDVKNRTNTLMSPVINVTAIPNLSVSIKHDAGATINIGNKITWSAFNSTGGKPPYTFAFYVHRNGTRVASTGYSKNYTYSYTPMQTGTYNATVFIKDSLNTIKYTTSTDITVTNPPTVPVQIDNLTANITSGKVGAKMIWDLKASGGTKPYRYAYYLYLDGKKIEERPYSTYAGFSHVAAVPGKYTVTGFVKDANGSTAHKTSAIITIVKPPETVTEINIVINKSADTVTVGTPISWTVNASGGTGTYTYAFYLRKDGKTIIKTPYGTSSAYNYTPSSTGTYAVVAYVKDSNGTIKYKISDTIIVN